MSYPTFSTDNGVGITDITGDIQIGVGINGLSITSGILSTPSTTVINQSGFTTGVNNFPFNALYQLNQALQALEVAPNATTVQYNNTILLQDPAVLTTSLTLDPTSIIALTDLTLNPNGGLGNINLEADNINSFGFATPICFTRERADTFTYNFNGTGVPQTLEQVYFTSFNIPQQFVADSPIAGYTSTRWKIDFALNTWNNSVTADKGIALFFTLQDATTSFNMSPQTYNATTPYAVYQPASTYVAGGGNAAFQNYNWTDWIDLAPLVSGGGSVLPLTLLLNFAADSAFSCNFQMTVTLTRTNLV
jgi:hypothetical protein